MRPAMFRTHTRSIYTRLRGVNDVLIALSNQEDQHPMSVTKKCLLVGLIKWLNS